nr:beta-lactamase family protein [Pseudomonadales bacterium]
MKMKNWLRKTCLLLAATLLSAQAFSLDVTDRDTVEAFIDGAVKPLMQNKHGPAGVVMVMKDGEVILNKGYGYQDLDKKIPVDAYSTLFRPGSISKLFTWIAVLQMEEQGKLDLDADVNEHLTQFKVKDAWEGQPVTMRHIMTHRGGFEDGLFGYLIIDDADRITPLAEALEKYQPERINPPGEHTSYSNWATALAGLIVANVSGVEFNQYIQENIFDVLGMEHASFVEPLPPELDALMAKHYQYPDGRHVEKPYEIISNFGPAGALAASAGSMERFGRALLNGGELDGARILQPKTVARFLGREFSHDPRTRGMGLGALHYPYNGIDVVGHDGGTTTFVSHFGLALEEDFMFYVSFNGPAAAG